MIIFIWVKKYKKFWQIKEGVEGVLIIFLLIFIEDKVISDQIDLIEKKMILFVFGFCWVYFICIENVIIERIDQNGVL